MASGSHLLARELYDADDPGFVNELVQAAGGKKLRRFAVAWAEDRTDFARRTRLSFADCAIDRGDARVLVKVLFKAAEQRRDDVEMAHYMVAFDRFVQRTAVPIQQWDYQERQWVVAAYRRGLPLGPRRSVPYPYEPPTYFSTNTCHYLQRRALRYFRRLGQADPERFGQALRYALSLYDDQHFPAPDSILDCRSLCILLYGGSDQLLITGRGLDLKQGNLEELEPAPIFSAVWRSEEAFSPLLRLVAAAPSAFVRGWCATYLKRAHETRLATLSLEHLRGILGAPHGEAQSLGADLLERIEGWGQVPVQTWLELAALDNPRAVATLARLMRQHVSPDRLTLAQCLELSKSRVMPIAELGLGWAIDKGLSDDDAVNATSALAEAETEAIRARGLSWLRPRLTDKKRSLLVRDLVDSRHRDVRAVALEVSETQTYADDARVHAAMAESPYGDVTDALTERLERWERSLDPASLEHLWATILLGVRRGSRAKRATLRVLAERAVARPESAPDLLPLVAVALRSVREPERRAALATLARAAFAKPELRELIAEHVPDLSIEAPLEPAGVAS